MTGETGEISCDDSINGTDVEPINQNEPEANEQAANSNYLFILEIIKILKPRSIFFFIFLLGGTGDIVDDDDMESLYALESESESKC